MSKQSPMLSSFDSNSRRLALLQNDLVAIAYAMGSSRPRLQRPGPWYEACRDPQSVDPQRPYLIEDRMISDAVQTVALRGTAEEKAQVRNAVTQYFDTRLKLSLEPLGLSEAESLLELCKENIEEGAEATAAVVAALSTKSPADFETAERETLESVTTAERLHKAFAAARARFYTPRSVRLFQQGAR